MSEEDIKNDAKSYKEYKLYCQLKVWFVYVKIYFIYSVNELIDFFFGGFKAEH